MIAKYNLTYALKARFMRFILDIIE